MQSSLDRSAFRISLPLRGSATDEPTAARTRSFVSGDRVQVCSAAEILATLEPDGTLDGLPFMPEMLSYCGREFTVSQRAHKTCIEFGRMGSFDDVVFLEDLRCDGSAHAGCGRGCLLFWKERWLKEVGAASTSRTVGARISERELALLAATRDPFFCQSTRLTVASKRLSAFNLKQYVLDLRSGCSYLQLIKSLFLLVYNKLALALGKPELGLQAGDGTVCSTAALNLQPGELVRVKPWDIIRKTLDAAGKHRGMVFTSDMHKYIGKEFRVRSRLEQIILEHTGQMRTIKDTVILDQTICDGMCRRMCPRRAFFFWREAWLERVENISPPIRSSDS